MVSVSKPDVVDLRGRREWSLSCFDTDGEKVVRSGVRGVEKTLPPSLLAWSKRAEERRFMLLVFRRKPDTVDENDFLEETEGVREAPMWKLDDERRV